MLCIPRPHESGFALSAAGNCRDCNAKPAAGRGRSKPSHLLRQVLSASVTGHPGGIKPLDGSLIRSLHRARHVSYFRPTCKTHQNRGQLGPRRSALGRQRGGGSPYQQSLCHSPRHCRLRIRADPICICKIGQIHTIRRQNACAIGIAGKHNRQLLPGHRRVRCKLRRCGPLNDPIGIAPTHGIAIKAFGFTSSKGLGAFFETVSPDNRYRTVISCPLVILCSGANVSSPVPTIRPCRKQKSTPS